MRALLTAALVVAFSAAVHYGVTQGQVAPALVLLVLIAAPGLLAALRAGRYLPVIVVLSLALAGAQFFNSGALLYAVPMLVTGSLALLFARTLMPGRTPLITAFVHLQYGQVPPEMAVYTRLITGAWAVFLALMTVEAALLAAFARPAVWSLFVNGINYLLVFAFFLGEYSVRRRVLRDMPHASFAKFLSNVAKTDLRRLVRS